MDSFRHEYELRIWFNLALHMGKSVKECRDYISETEFEYWYAFYLLEGIGWKRDGLTSAMIKQAIAGLGGSQIELQNCLYDPYRIPDEDDDELMAMIDDSLADMKERAERGEFDHLSKEKE